MMAALASVPAARSAVGGAAFPTELLARPALLHTCWWVLHGVAAFRIGPSTQAGATARRSPTPSVVTQRRSGVQRQTACRAAVDAAEQPQMIDNSGCMSQRRGLLLGLGSVLLAAGAAPLQGAAAAEQQAEAAASSSSDELVAFSNPAQRYTLLRPAGWEQVCMLHPPSGSKALPGAAPCDPTSHQPPPASQSAPLLAHPSPAALPCRWARRELMRCFVTLHKRAPTWA